MTRSLRTALAVLAAAVAAGAAPGVASAAAWCGTASEQDRAPVLAGHPVRVVYALPADGTDRSAELAPRIWADVEQIDAWWRASDATRTPRFDLFPFPCGAQVDLTLTRLASRGDDIRVAPSRWDRIWDDLDDAGFDSDATKYLVYYDGPTDDRRVCGQGGGFADGGGVAIVYVQACERVSTASTAAHELLHALGALSGASAPNSCPDSRAHVCDAPRDVLYSFAQDGELASFSLDLNRDDYYAHGQSWFDVRDSMWLRHLDAQVPLSLTVVGRGTVASDVPGLTCAATCRTEWNAGTLVVLTPQPAPGQRFVRWTGKCRAELRACAPALDSATALTAVFAPARFALTVGVAGRGRVSGAGAACTSPRCARSVVSHRALVLRATPAPGWRLAGWSGTCRGAKSTCRVPMTEASTVRARFVRG